MNQEADDFEDMLQGGDMLRVIVVAMTITAAMSLTESAGMVNAGTRVHSEPVQNKRDPCTFFTKAELEAAFGYPLQPAKPDMGLPSCGFNGRNNPSITIALPPEPTTPQEFREFMTLAGGDEAEAVSGIGDAAFVWLSRIYVRVGTKTVTVSAGIDKASPKVRETLLAVGKTAATRLKQ